MVQAAIAGSRKVLPHPVSRVNAFLLLYLEAFTIGLGLSKPLEIT
jgi:hypothetical protein